MGAALIGFSGWKKSQHSLPYLPPYDKEKRCKFYPLSQSGGNLSLYVFILVQGVVRPSQLQSRLH